MHDRAVLYLTTINVGTGLLLSGTIGSALSPLEVATLPEESQLLGDVYNVLCVFH